MLHQGATPSEAGTVGEVEDNAREAASRVLGEPVEASASVRLGVIASPVWLFAPLAVVVPRILDHLGRLLGARRKAKLPSAFMLVVTATRVAALEPRYGGSVVIKRLLVVWPRGEVCALPGLRPGWMNLQLPDRPPLELEPVVPGGLDGFLRDLAP